VCCKKQLSTANGAAECETGRDTGYGKMLCSVVKY
jgi:hypothetical protein